MEIHLKAYYLIIVRMNNTEHKICGSCKRRKPVVIFLDNYNTCEICRNKVAQYRMRHPDKVKEQARNWSANHIEEKKANNQIEIECETCKCKIKKPNWARHLRTAKHLQNERIKNGEEKNS